MQFLNPWGALALLLLVPLVILYLLRQRHQEVKIPSTLLWEQVLTQWEASHPWQRWRRSLLFFLQALAILLLALALMRPVWRQSGIGQNNIIILDVSLSMQAQEEGQTRLERAKTAAAGLIRQMRSGEAVTLMVCGAQNELLVARSQDAGAVLQLLEQVQAQNGESQLEEALQMAEAMLDNESSEVIHLFTDREVVCGESTMLHNLAIGAENTALTSVSYSRGTTGLNVLGLLYNFGTAKTVNVELWGDGLLLDVQECELAADSAGNVLFGGLDSSLRILSLAISEEDALVADNRAFCVVQDEQTYRVLLQTERNVFLEKAILLREDIELYKTTPGELTEQQYDLLIGDGWASSTLPANQDVWLIAPSLGNEWFSTAEAELGDIRAADTQTAAALLRYVDFSSLQVAGASTLLSEDVGSSPLAYMGEQPIILLQEDGGIRRLCFGFDLHDSNLPLQKDFPILVQNILAWFLPPKEGQSAGVAAGKPIRVALQAETAFYDIRLPDGELLQQQVQRQFEQTGQLGFYAVTQFNEAGEVIGESRFAVGTPLDESELRTAGSGGGTAQQGELWRSWNLWPYLILAALILMAAEWWVYHRGA